MIPLLFLLLVAPPDTVKTNCQVSYSMISGKSEICDTVIVYHSLSQLPRDTTKRWKVNISWRWKIEVDTLWSRPKEFWWLVPDSAIVEAKP